MLAVLIAGLTIISTMEQRKTKREILGGLSKQTTELTRHSIVETRHFGMQGIAVGPSLSTGNNWVELANIPQGAKNLRITKIQGGFFTMGATGYLNYGTVTGFLRFTSSAVRTVDDVNSTDVRLYFPTASYFTPMEYNGLNIKIEPNQLIDFYHENLSTNTTQTMDFSFLITIEYDL